MSIESLEVELKEIELKIQPLLELQSRRIRQLNTEKSKVFISANSITKDKVQLCDDDGMPWLGTIYAFGEWINENSIKPYCCWNGSIYDSKEIIAGRMARDPIGKYQDLAS